MTTARYTVFAHATAENASLYRAIMRIFVESNERFATRLRPREIRESLRDLAAPGEIESALTRLCEWGNLQTSADVADIASAEDFYKPRQVFSMTAEGEAAERAFALLDTPQEIATELETTSLADIRYVLQELRDIFHSP